MTAIEKICCAVDLGETTAEVCQYAARIASALQASVVLCHVAESLPQFQRQARLEQVRAGEDGEIVTAEGASPLRPLMERYFAELPVEGHVLLDTPAEGIARLARNHGCHMILLGAPRTGLSAMVRPSVGRRVQRISGLPVTMVGSRPDETALRSAAPLQGLAW